jgi:RNA polymerase sigma factor (sigma-70 family)
MNGKNNKFPDISIGKLLVQFDSLIRVVSKKFAASNKLHPFTEEDLYQYITLRLMENLPAIRFNYKGNAKVKTYLAAVLRNYAHEFIRKNKLQLLPSISLNKFGSIPYEEIQEATIKWDKRAELERIKRIMILFGNKQGKIEFVLKGFCRMPLSEVELNPFREKHHDFEWIKELIRKLNSYQKPTDKDIISLLNQLFNHLDGKNNGDEAMRKWIDRTLNEIIELLNSSKDKRFYNKDGLTALLTIYFEGKMNTSIKNN